MTNAIPDPAVLAAARRIRELLSESGSPAPWDSIPEARQRYWSALGADVLAAGLAAIDPSFLEPRHILLIGEDRWTLQHPLACRPRLADCPTHKLVAASWDDQLSWMDPGEWPVHVHPDGCITLGDTPGDHPHHQSQLDLPEPGDT